VRLSALPPVRRSVPLKRGSRGARLSMERFFGDRTITLYPSGTAALAKAIADCAARSSASAPEVIIPAYGCPDLVAACLHAGVYPRVVDVMPSHWSYDPAALASGLSPDTVAIVAVNLLGLGDGADELAPLCKSRAIYLIQDSAQYLPRQVSNWPGDYVILSFGRGKPLNLLHGGAMIENPAARSARSTELPTAHYTFKDRLLASRAAAMSFNILTRPHVYRLFSMLPGTGLGKVTYKPLGNAAPLPESAWDRVGIGFELYRQKRSYRRDIWESSLGEWSMMGVEALSCPGSALQTEPLRLALLAPDEAAREVLVNTLNQNGLGASRFYDTDLTGVAAIPEVITSQGPFPQAKTLAGRLFTLPTHELVTPAALEATCEAVRAWHRTAAAPHVTSAALPRQAAKPGTNLE